MTESATTQQQTQFNVLLLGDDCLDVYQYGTVDRISPEAPVPVFKFSHNEHRGGMASNVKANLEALGCKVNFILPDKISTKTRLIDIRSKQQLLRIDDDVVADTVSIQDLQLSDYDAVVISDYNKGAVSYDLMEKVIRQSNHGVNFSVFIDTKKTDLERLQGAWVKINELEYSKITSECTGLIVTQGDKGAKIKWHEFECAAPTVEVVDVTGAGDTFLSALTYQYLNTKNIKSSVEFAICASSITVQHLGVYAPTLKEIK